MDNIFPPTAERHALLAIERRYGALAVLDFSDPPTCKRCLCRCDCGRFVERSVEALVSGEMLNCGNCRAAPAAPATPAASSLKIKPSFASGVVAPPDARILDELAVAILLATHRAHRMKAKGRRPALKRLDAFANRGAAVLLAAEEQR
jgi:hypothetical protein